MIASHSRHVSNPISWSWVGLLDDVLVQLTRLLDSSLMLALNILMNWDNLSKHSIYPSNYILEFTRMRFNELWEYVEADAGKRFSICNFISKAIDHSHKEWCFSLEST